MGGLIVNKIVHLENTDIFDLCQKKSETEFDVEIECVIFNKGLILFEIQASEET